MENNRYKILKTKIHKEWLADSPVKVEKSQLVYDLKKNQIILQVKFFNLSDKNIRSVFINVNCFDEAMNLISNLTDVAYLGIDEKPKSVFGDRQPVILNSLKVDNVEVIISKVVFTDNTVWKNENNKIGILLPEQKMINKNDVLYEQIKREFKGKITPIYWFESSIDYWSCTCGQANNKDAIICGYCGAKKEWLENHLDKDYLLSEDNKFKQAELIHIKNEEEIQKSDELIRNKELKNHKNKKFKWQIIVIIICVIPILYYIYKINQSNIVYNETNESEYNEKAIGNFETGDYEKAIENFEAGDYQIAEDIFKRLINYKSSKEYLKKIELLKPIQGNWVDIINDKVKANINGTSLINIYSDGKEYIQGLRIIDNEVVTGVNDDEKLYIEDNNLIIEKNKDGNVTKAEYRKIN